MPKHSPTTHVRLSEPLTHNSPPEGKGKEGKRSGGHPSIDAEGPREATPLHPVDNPHAWICAICLRTARWGTGWEWYGSYRAEETCGHLIATCSAACRRTTKAHELVVAYDRDHATKRCRQAA